MTTMAPEITKGLSEHLQQIVRIRDPFLESGNHFYVKEYIRQKLSEFGIVETQYFSGFNHTYENLILNISPSKIATQPPILIAAHYDSVPGSPGADDNATGVAVLLELARHFSQEPPAKYPLRLVAFDLEEYGLLGSRAYAKFLKTNKQSLRLMICLEMLGYATFAENSQRYPLNFFKYIYPSQGNFIALIGNLLALPDLRKISQGFAKVNVATASLPVPLRGFILPDTRRSDHAPFWDCGYDAIMITDTANLRNPHYHQTTDTIETLDLDFLTRVCLGLMAAIDYLNLSTKPSGFAR